MDSEWVEVKRYPEGEESPACVEYKRDNVTVSVKWDRCVNLCITRGFDDEEEDDIHICDFPEFVKKLQELLTECEWVFK